MKTYETSTGGLRLTSCTYGLSRLSFRGPRRPTDGPFVACLGGSDTFARYVPKPYPDLIETAIGEVCVNFGCQAAGPDVYLNDPAMRTLRRDAAATVLQIPGAANLSNAFYRVHPRRNDRFVAPTNKLKMLFPEVDFAEISFTGHLISRLNAVDEARFALVRTALQNTWLHRMIELVEDATGPVLLLWFASRTPADEGAMQPHMEPVFVTADMVEALRDHVDDIIEVVHKRGTLEGMSFAPLDTLAAGDALGVDAHMAAAKALRTPLMHALS
ncbi:DUF6473 family protein [Pseudooctadecabacter jejudonensis]|uniref:DUF6473 domain-containing protein n=1 Tax=Pseudooctadecabacter jejudonensis TaxID=1391910 RepID=A0A1Y5S1E9_9RHOB|nr:DUF6473 family protein [Pseudooctadecabacter jejudonensis]SLN29020.1 hypothetical protein PSJ8397_01247 [Pseudooctadecabacter jejudonensis]